MKKLHQEIRSKHSVKRAGPFLCARETLQTSMTFAPVSLRHPGGTKYGFHAACVFIKSFIFQFLFFLFFDKLAEAERSELLRYFHSL